MHRVPHIRGPQRISFSGVNIREAYVGDSRIRANRFSFFFSWDSLKTVELTLDRSPQRGDEPT